MHHFRSEPEPVGLVPAPGSGSDLTQKCFGSGSATQTVRILQYYKLTTFWKKTGLVSEIISNTVIDRLNSHIFQDLNLKSMVINGLDRAHKPFQIIF